MSSYKRVIGMMSLGMLLSAGTVRAGLPCNVAEIANPEPTAFDWFGESVAISGEVAVFGAGPTDSGVGSVYVYRYDGGTWLLEQALPNPEPSALDFFGQQVALDANVLVVGAGGDDPSGVTDAGSVYMYRYNGLTWVLEAIANPELAQSDLFGHGVGISGDVTIVGAYRHDPGGVLNAGSVYAYRYNGSEWLLEQAIPNPEPAELDWFGWSVAVSGNVAVVPAYRDDAGGVNDAGSVYIYRYNGSAWLLEQVIPNPEPSDADFFGRSVAVSGDVIVVGAENDDPGGIEDTGSAYVFRFDGLTWLLEQTIPNPNPAETDAFAFSVAASGDVVTAGAFSDSPGDVVNVGSAYVYRFNGSVWLLERAIPNPEPDEQDQFGRAVAVSGDLAVVGARHNDAGDIVDAGSGYVIELQIPLGDLNCDEAVDGSDFAIWQACLQGPEVGVDGCCVGSDFSGDGYVDLTDFGLFQNSF